MALPSETVSGLPLPEQLRSFLGVGSTPSVVIREDAATAAAEPLVISLCGPSGRTTVQRSFTDLDDTFSHVKLYFKKALQTASYSSSISKSQLLTYAGAGSILLDYGSELPLEAISLWLDADGSAVDGSCRRLLLSCSGESVYLVLAGSSLQCYTTGVSYGEIMAYLASVTPDGSHLLFEQQPDTRLDPLIPADQTVNVPNAVSENPYSDDFADTIASALHFNPYGSGSYTDPTGKHVYTEQSRTCSVTTAGQVTLTVSGGSMPVEAACSAQIEYARKLLSTICSASLGQARLYLRSYDKEEASDRYSFGYVLDGVPVWPETATFTFNEAGLQEAVIQVCACRTGTSSITCLPFAQAAAIAPEGSSPTAVYVNSGKGTLSLSWNAK